VTLGDGPNLGYCHPAGRPVRVLLLTRDRPVLMEDNMEIAVIGSSEPTATSAKTNHKRDASFNRAAADKHAESIRAEKKQRRSSAHKVALGRSHTNG
jgi:hypothetical protein